MDSFLTEEERASRSAATAFEPVPSWLRAALILEERARSRPSGEPWPFPPVPGPADNDMSLALAEVASTMGSASTTLDRCYAAARAQGYFESTLMGFRDVHVELSELHSGLESVRLMTYRACRLLDRGDRPRGGGELARARTRAGDVAAKAEGARRRLLAGETGTKGADHET
jgi:hypothetical protein